TDMLMQFGTFPATGPALSRGIASGFGIDTICSAGNDLFSEMRLALAAERSRANAPALASGTQVPAVDLPQRDMLRPATIGGTPAGSRPARPAMTHSRRPHAVNEEHARATGGIKCRPGCWAS